MSDPFLTSGSPSQRQTYLFAVPPRETMTTHKEDDALDDEPRVKRAERTQIKFRACCWNDLIPDDHPVRSIWQYVQSLDLTPLYARIKATKHRPGQSPIDPPILFALWLYACVRGIGSARELDRRCDPQTGEVPFQWICGDVSVNHHTLSDFRTAHVELLDELLTASVAVLMEQDLVTLNRVAQDGMKVRASAGASSFRRGPTLEECLEEAKRQIEELKKELDEDPAAGNKRQKAARERAARERAERIAKALEEFNEVEKKKKTAEEKEKARASTTDPDAHVMKGPDGGYRPSYNVQLATDTATQVIVGVTVSTSGGDQGQMAPMVHQIEDRFGKAPNEMLVDGGFAKKEDIDEVSAPEGNTTVYAPPQKSKKAGVDPHDPRDNDSEAVAEWRKRMATEEAKQIYKERAATAECVNAIARNRGLYQVRVRGQLKVKAVILWYVIAHNMVRRFALRAEQVNQMN